MTNFYTLKLSLRTYGSAYHMSGKQVEDTLNNIYETFIGPYDIVETLLDTENENTYLRKSSSQWVGNRKVALILELTDDKATELKAQLRTLQVDPRGKLAWTYSCTKMSKRKQTEYMFAKLGV